MPEYLVLLKVNPAALADTIEAVPTFILFEEGKACKRLDGRLGYGLSEKQLEEWLQGKT